MTILVCGSREWTDEQAIRADLQWFLREHPGMSVMHGGARGADRIAGRVAESLGLDVTVFPADWRAGRHAGLERNLAMLDENPDLVLAYRLGGSRGTLHTITEARSRGIRTVVVER